MSKPKTKRCWIVWDGNKIYFCRKRPIYKTYTGMDLSWRIDNRKLATYFFYNSVTDVPPQLQKMWKKALKGKRGKNAIIECVWETWRPIMILPCLHCNGIGAHHEAYGYSCKTCDGTGKITRPMVEGDL